jgi:SAM-dependent methyltransferase
MSHSRRQLACPACRTALAEELRCERCDRRFARYENIPVLITELNDAKCAQMSHFDDGVNPEFEITRPHGQPRLYELVLQEKLRRVVEPIAGQLAGADVLCVCAGSGLDAEFLARRGARVVASDISPRAAARTAERAQRYGLDISTVIADVERLPFADDSFGVVFVHDGLHHIERPEAGLAEMARVARDSVCITEPADAAITRVAVRLGLAAQREESGNVVARLKPSRVADVLRSRGFEVVHSERYGMYYRHEPGLPMQILSLPLLFPVARSALRALNRVVGPAGNKLAVTAVRRSESNEVLV